MERKEKLLKTEVLFLCLRTKVPLVEHVKCGRTMISGTGQRLSMDMCFHPLSFRTSFAGLFESWEGQEWSRSFAIIAGILPLLPESRNDSHGL